MVVPSARRIPEQCKLFFAVSRCNSRFTECTAFDSKQATGATPFPSNRRMYEKTKLQAAREHSGDVGNAGSQHGACPNWRRGSQGENPIQLQRRTQTFPAGEYSLKPLLPHTMSLRNQAGQVLTSIGTRSVESTEVPKSVKLVFTGYDGHYFLAQIWKAGDNIGQELTKSPAEVEMATKYSSGPQIALLVGTHH